MNPEVVEQLERKTLVKIERLTRATCAKGPTKFFIFRSSGHALPKPLPEIVMQQIEHFFTHYKDLEPQKWVLIGHWRGAEDARRIISEAIERAAGWGKG